MKVRLGIVVALVLAGGAWLGTGVAWANSELPWCTTSQNAPDGTQCNPAGTWYTTPVQFSWKPSQGLPTNYSPSCNQATNYTSDTDTVLECDASWSGGPPLIPFVYPLLVEVSAPISSATPSRPPDSNGWYTHPVSVTFSGSGFSGTASCAPVIATYGGPATANAVLTSACTDPAGKTAPASLTLNYDDTPPTITTATAARKPDANGYYTHPVKFTFNGTDATSGVASCQTVMYSGPGSGSVVGGCWDRAGNYASVSVPVRYRGTASATAPRSKSPIVLRWKRARGASYYNVQIYRAGKKVFSSWPVRTSLRLRKSWSFAGHRFRLKPGRYRWYVWPGYGSRARASYGRMLVNSSFKITKRS